MREQLRKRTAEKSDAGVEVDRSFAGVGSRELGVGAIPVRVLRLPTPDSRHPRRQFHHELSHRSQKVPVDLKERVGGDVIAVDQQFTIGDQLAVDFPCLSLARLLARLHADHFALARQRDDVIGAHRVKADLLAVAMEPAAQSVIQRRWMDRDRRQRALVDLADAPQRLRQNPLFRFELLVEAKRRPVASAAFVADRTRHRAPERARLDDADEIGVRETLLHLEQPDDRDIAGIDVRGEDRKSVDARNRGAARDELGWSDGDFVAGVHHGKDSGRGARTSLRVVRAFRARPEPSFAACHDFSTTYGGNAVAPSLLHQTVWRNGEERCTTSSISIGKRNCSEAESSDRTRCSSSNSTASKAMKTIVRVIMSLIANTITNRGSARSRRWSSPRSCSPSPVKRRWSGSSAVSSRRHAAFSTRRPGSSSKVSFATPRKRD